jgi:hypothetical protein
MSLTGQSLDASDASAVLTGESLDAKDRIPNERDVSVRIMTAFPHERDAPLRLTPAPLPRGDVRLPSTTALLCKSTAFLRDRSAPVRKTRPSLCETDSLIGCSAAPLRVTRHSPHAKVPSAPLVRTLESLEHAVLRTCCRALSFADAPIRAAGAPVRTPVAWLSLSLPPPPFARSPVGGLTPAAIPIVSAARTHHTRPYASRLCMCVTARLPCRFAHKEASLRPK